MDAHPERPQALFVRFMIVRRLRRTRLAPEIAQLARSEFDPWRTVYQECADRRGEFVPLFVIVRAYGVQIDHAKRSDHR
jgi:hypothetical protein